MCGCVRLVLAAEAVWNALRGRDGVEECGRGRRKSSSV